MTAQLGLAFRPECRHTFSFETPRGYECHDCGELLCAGCHAPLRGAEDGDRCRGCQEERKRTCGRCGAIDAVFFAGDDEATCIACQPGAARVSRK